MTQFIIGDKVRILDQGAELAVGSKQFLLEMEIDPKDFKTFLGETLEGQTGIIIRTHFDTDIHCIQLESGPVVAVFEYENGDYALEYCI